MYSFEFSEIVQTDVSAGVFQTLLVVLAKVLPKEFKKLSKMFAKESFPEEFELSFFDCEPFCRTLETMITHSQSAPKLWKQLNDRYFKGHVAELSQHPVANFAVQKMLASCEDKAQVRFAPGPAINEVFTRHFHPQFEHLYETELDNHLEDILASGNTGVVLAMAQACRKLSAKQAHFFVVSSPLSFGHRNAQNC
jgi:hypothetical protein